jgi:hypothetical protein
LKIEMACCAFAVFVLMQVTAPFVWLWERTFGRHRTRTNAAVSWTFGRAAISPGSATVLTSPLRKGLLIALAFELVVVVAAVQLSVRAQTSAEDWVWAEALHDSWCRAAVRG